MSRSNTLDTLLAELPELPERLRCIKEILLTNVVMVGETPAPTFQERDRIRFLCDRFTESGLLDISTDEKGNATALLPGTEGEKTILVAANADNVNYDGVDPTVSVGVDTVTGVGLSDNGLAIASLITLPTILERLGVKLKNNLVLTAATQTLGTADMAGFKFFLDNVKTPIDSAVCLRGSELGRISYSSLGAMRGKIVVAFAEGQGWHRQSFPGAVVEMGAILHKILSIPIPRNPRTTILLGSLNAGATFNTAPSRATLQFEIRSEDADWVHKIERQIDMIVEEVDAGTGATVQFDKIGRREPSALPYSHPFVQVAHDIVTGLDLLPRVRPSSGLLSNLTPRGIPAITLGLTQRESADEVTEVMQIEPLFAGLAQVVALLRAIDEGLCHEQD